MCNFPDSAVEEKRMGANNQPPRLSGFSLLGQVARSSVSIIAGWHMEIVGERNAQVVCVWCTFSYQRSFLYIPSMYIHVLGGVAMCLYLYIHVCTYRRIDVDPPCHGAMVSHPHKSITPKA